MQSVRRMVFLGIFVCCFGIQARAQTFNERFTDWPIDLKINGRVIVAGSLSDVSIIEPLLGRSRESQKLLLIAPSNQQVVLREQYQKLYSEVAVVDSVRGHFDHQDATAIAWHVSPYYRTAYQYLDRHQEVFSQLLKAGGSLILVGPNAAWCSKLFVGDEGLPPVVKKGASLLPDCVLHTMAAKADYEVEKSRVMSVLAVNPQSVGILLEPGTALSLIGRKMLVVGSGEATFVLAANERHPHRVERLVARNPESRQPTTDWLLDLTEWRRDAIDRTLEQFPLAVPGKPRVENGSLFIVGGGGLPAGLMNDFVQAAGGPQEAQLVYVPCSEADEIRTPPSMLRTWEKMGVKQATVLHTKDRLKANNDEAFYEPLKTATGIWFGGGRQWNFADSYYGTTTHKLMKQVLARGGTIGGSSAGASVQARYLARATPIENFRIMAPGYERGGLGFLSGVAIDQHFTQRRRQPDMTQLMDRYPQLLGIGIDETTAIIVTHSSARVVGQGRVHFYDRNLPVYPDRPDFVALKAGGVYDLANRKVVTSTQDRVE